MIALDCSFGHPDRMNGAPVIIDDDRGLSDYRNLGACPEEPAAFLAVGRPL
jgi:hypothetical protein